jgi:hypothetical protein
MSRMFMPKVSNVSGKSGKAEYAPTNLILTIPAERCPITVT